MHVNDFRDDLTPTRAQLARIVTEFARLAGEPDPTSRRSATELLLRLEASDSPQAEAERAIARTAYADRAARADRGARTRAGAA